VNFEHHGKIVVDTRHVTLEVVQPAREPER
jgi:hypothetical protein